VPDLWRDAHRRAVELMAAAFAGAPEESVPGPPRRVAGSVGLGFEAGQFYSQKVSEARGPS